MSEWFDKDRVITIDLGAGYKIQVFSSRIEEIRVYMLIDSGNPGYVVSIQGCKQVYEAVTAAKEFLKKYHMVAQIFNDIEPREFGA